MHDERITSLKLLRNIGYNFFGQVWLILLSLLTTPFIVKKLGVSAYGVLSLVFVVLQYFTFLELGMGTAIIKYISEYYARKEYSNIKRIIGTSFFVYFLLAFLGALFITVFSEFLVTRILKIPLELKQISVIVFYLTAIGFFINMPLNVLGAVPRALQRFDIVNKINISFATFSILSSVLVLYLGFYLSAVVILNLIGSVGSFIAYYLVNKRLLSNFSISPSFEWQIFKKLIKFGGFIFVTQIMAKIVLYLDKFLIGFFLPISNLSYYVIPFNLSKKLLLPQELITPVIFPTISNLSAEKEKKKILNDLYLRSIKFVMVFTLPLALLIIAFAHPFLLLWLGVDFASRATLPLQILAGVFWLNSLTAVPATTMQAIGLPQTTAKFSTFVVIAEVVLYIFYIPWLGIIGAALSLLICQFIFMPLFIVITNERLQIRNGVLIKQNFYKSILIGGFFFTFLIFLKNEMTSMIRVITTGILSIIIFFLFAYFIVLDREERGFLKQYLLNITKRNEMLIHHNIC